MVIKIPRTKWDGLGRKLRAKNPWAEPCVELHNLKVECWRQRRNSRKGRRRMSRAPTGSALTASSDIQMDYRDWRLVTQREEPREEIRQNKKWPEGWRLSPGTTKGRGRREEDTAPSRNVPKKCSARHKGWGTRRGQTMQKTKRPRNKKSHCDKLEIS